MRMKFAFMAAALLSVSGLHVASAATKHTNATKKPVSATVTLINMDKPNDILLKADVDLTKTDDQVFKSESTLGYVAGVQEAGKDTKPVLTPGEVDVGYVIHAKKGVGDNSLSLDVTANYLGDNGFIPVADMTRQFQTFTSEGVTIELPNVTSIQATDSYTLPENKDYKEALFYPGIGHSLNSGNLALRIELHYAK